MTAELKDDAPIPPEINKYLTILSKDPNSMVFAPLAESYRKAGMLDEAIATAQNGLKLHPNYLSAMVALGRAYYEKGMLKEAKDELEQVVRMAPDNIVAVNILEEIKRKSGVGSTESAVENQNMEETETDELIELEEVTELTELEAEGETEGFQVEEISFEAQSQGLGFSEEVPAEKQAGIVEVPEIKSKDQEPAVAKEDIKPKKEITTETIAELYIKQGYLDKAIDIYQTLFDADPGNEDIKRKLGELKGKAEVGRVQETLIWSQPEESLETEDVIIKTAEKKGAVKEAESIGDETVNKLESWLKTIQSERRKG